MSGKKPSTAKKQENHGLWKKHRKMYQCWQSMIQRCHNKNSTEYHNYGGRGITVSDDWRGSFSRFFEDMGAKPDGMSIERIENNDGYHKDNCRWATTGDQCFNQRRNHLITHDGRTMPLKKWADETGVHPATLGERIRKGWPVELALSPIKRRHGCIPAIEVINGNRK